MTVRAASDSDLPSIAGIHCRARSAAYQGIVPQPTLEAMTVPSVAAWWRLRLAGATERHRMLVAETPVAENGTQVVGFAYLGPTTEPGADDRAGELFAIHVDPPYQGLGVGRLLMESARSCLTDLGFDNAVLWVLSDNSRAERFYQRGGWATDGGERVGLIGDALTRQVRYAHALKAHFASA